VPGRNAFQTSAPLTDSERWARRDRPSIGWHDPWRAELCDAKAKVAWVSSERKGSQELAPPLTPRLHVVRMRTNMTPHDHDDDHDDDGGRSSATPSHCARRKRPAHFPTITVGFRSTIIFLTVCTRCRKPLLANDEAARLIADSWRAANFWRVGRYVIMPDHIHLFCAPNTFPAQPLKKWIGFWRNRVTRAWPCRSPGSDLATRVLGSAVAPLGVLCGKMAVREE